MSATKEQWIYSGTERVWAGKYKNSQNTLHWHSDCELIFVEHGSLEVVCDGTTYFPKRGDAMFIDSESLHRIHALTSDTLLKTVIFDNKLISDFSGGIRLSSPVLSGSYGTEHVYERILSELTRKEPLYDAATAAAVTVHMIDIFRGEPTEPKKQKAPTDIKLKDLFTEIREHYDTYTLDDAAKFMGMNPSYLSRIFTDKTGMHLMRYINSVRVEKAVEMLLRGDGNVTEVADKCGFGTIRNFNRIFKLLTGYAPSALPKGYVYAATDAEHGETNVNPTLFGCELVECSSVK